MLDKIILFLFVLGLTTYSYADEIQINPEHPNTYTVVKGDTLWDISEKFLMEPWRWPGIWKGNPQIENPHLIYPGDIISLSYDEAGNPVLSTVSTDLMQTDLPTMATQQTGSGRVVKLTPNIRVHKRDAAIQAIPISSIKNFLINIKVASKDEIDSWPYVLSSSNQRIINATDNTIYVRDLNKADAQNRFFSIYRKGKAYTSPNKKNKFLGYEAVYVGSAEMVKAATTPDGVTTMKVTSTVKEVLFGDRLVAQTKDKGGFISEFIPRQPYSKVDGRIISVYGANTQISKYMIVTLDVGEVEGLEAGNVLAIYRPGKVVKDPIGGLRQYTQKRNQQIRFKYHDENIFDRALAQIYTDFRNTKRKLKADLPEYFLNKQILSEKVTLPKERTGVLMVFQTSKEISHAIIMNVNDLIKINDIVKNL